MLKVKEREEEGGEKEWREGVGKDHGRDDERRLGYESSLVLVLVNSNSLKQNRHTFTRVYNFQ